MNVQQTGNDAGETDIGEEADDQEIGGADNNAGEHSDAPSSARKYSDEISIQRLPIERRSVERGSIEKLAAGQTATPRTSPPAIRFITASSIDAGGETPIAPSAGSAESQADVEAAAPLESSAGRPETPDAPRPAEQDSGESRNGLAAHPAPIPALPMTANPTVAINLPAHDVTGLLESGAEAIAPAQTKALPFGESAVKAAIPPAIISTASTPASAVRFSAIAIADAAIEAIAASTPAVADGAEHLANVVADGATIPQASLQLAYHFARVNAAATFSDALGRFIDDCASLAPAIIQADRNPARGRAWRITLAVAAADVALIAYVLHRARDRRRRAAVVRSLWQNASVI